MTDSVQAIQESYTRIKLLTNDIQIKDQTIAILQERLQELEDQVNNTFKQKEYAERQYQILQDEHDAMFDNTQKKTKQLQQFNQQLLIALKEVQDKNQELLEKVKYQQQEIQQRQQNQQEVQDQVSLIKEAVKSLEDELSVLQKRNHHLKKEKQGLDDQIKNLQNETYNKEQQLNIMAKQFENESDLLKNELNDYRNKLEQQHNELVDLKYIKLQHEDLENKYQQLNEQYKVAVQSAIEQEQHFNCQFDEINQANLQFSQQYNEMQQDLKSQKDYNLQVEQQNQDFQRLFNYIQQQINETIDEVLTVKQKKITVYERLYEGRKSNNIRKSVPKKKKKTSFNQIQIEEFFSDIKEIIQSLISTNTQLKDENESLNKNMVEMHKVGEQLRYRIEQLNSEYMKGKDQMKLDHQLIVEQYDEKINQMQDTIEQQNQKSLQDNQYINELLEQCQKYDQQIYQMNLDYNKLNQEKQDLCQEYDEQKQIYTQLQTELEDILVRKAISQNKVALSYGFIGYLMKTLPQKQCQINQILINLGNFVHYFVQIRKELYNDKYPLYLKFRKAVYAIIFINKIKKNNNYQIKEISFRDNDLIDEVFSKYIPIFHQIEEDQQQEDYNYNIVQQMHKDIQFQLNKYTIYTVQRANNSQFYFQILNYAKEDTIKFQTIFGQIDYYKQQLSMLQQRVYQLDQYVNQLENELQDRTPQYEEQSKYKSEDSPHHKDYSISSSLQNELVNILNKKSQPQFNRIGQIVKQGL